MFRPFTGHDIIVSVIIAALLVCSALVSGSETAFFSLTPRNIAQLKAGRSRSGRAILKLLSVQEYLLATILIVNNLVNISIAILSNGLIDSLVDFGGAVGLEFVVKTVVVAFLLLLFGEIMPKIFASYDPLRVARMTSIPLLLLESVFRPLAYMLIRSGSCINESVAKKRVNISIDELSNAIGVTTDQTVEQRRMLSGIVGFAHTEVVEIMKPRVDIVALDLRDDFAEVRRVIIESGFSRIPVYEDGIDDVKGVLYVKDMLPYISHGDDFEWQHLIRRAYFVPEHKKISDLLEEFQNNKIHMAIVVDEYGSTLGLVSLEDILEEIVGEISDESDTEQSFYAKLSENTYLFDGKTHLNDFLKVLSLDEDYLDEARGEAETLAGLMLEIRKDFLRRGETLAYRRLTLRVDATDGRRIDKIRVTVAGSED